MKNIINEIGLERIPAIVKEYDDDEAERRSSEKYSQVGSISQTDEVLAKMIGESRNQLHRYLRLTEVIPAILDLVDQKIVALVTAVEISYLPEKVQNWLFEYMKENGACKAYQIYPLRDYLKENDDISKMETIRILNENLPRDESNRFQRIELTKSKLLEFFPPFYTKPQMENVILLMSVHILFGIDILKESLGKCRNE